eukprot:gene2765-3546_t
MVATKWKKKNKNAFRSLYRSVIRLLPLSMARHTMPVLSETPLAAFIPFERTVGMHVHMGYTMEQHAGLEPTPNGVFTFCEKFESEIFRTGLGILAGIILLATSSFLRNRIPYEIFYYGHHVVFAIFTLAIAHTMDQKARDHGQERSQSFKWFTATLTLYIADRLFMGFNMRSLPVVEWSALGDRMQEDTRFVILNLEVKVMCPYGVAISDYSSFRHKMTIGTGTGVVRMLSLMKSVYLQLMQINAETHHDCSDDRTHT